MKLLLVLADWDPNLGYFDNNLVHELLAQGYAVTVVTGKGRVATHQNVDTSSENSVGLRIVQLPYWLNVSHYLFVLRGLVAVVLKESPDVLVFNDGDLNLLYGRSLKRRVQNLHLLLKCHCDSSNSARTWISRWVVYPLVRVPIFKRTEPFLDGVLAVTPQTAKFMLSVYGAGRNNVTVMPMFSRFRHDSKRKARYREEVRKALNIPGDAVVLFTGGKLDEYKRTDILLEALARRSLRSVYLIIAGKYSDSTPKYTERLRCLASKNSKVISMGWQDQLGIEKLICASDLGVFPASQTTLWQDAMCLGVPLIVGAGSENGDQDPSYLNKYGGVVIIDRNLVCVDTIGDEIETLLGSPRTIAEMSAQVLIFASEYLNPNRTIPEFFLPKPI